MRVESVYDLTQFFQRIYFQDVDVVIYFGLQRPRPVNHHDQYCFPVLYEIPDATRGGDDSFQAHFRLSQYPLSIFSDAGILQEVAGIINKPEFLRRSEGRAMRLLNSGIATRQVIDKKPGTPAGGASSLGIRSEPVQIGRAATD